MIKKIVLSCAVLAVMVYMVGAVGCIAFLDSPGTISGRVVDKDGNPVKDAVIKTTPSTSTMKTDAEGTYFIPNVKSGTYRITASKDGYTDANSNPITVGGLSCLPGSGNVQVEELTLQPGEGDLAVTLKDRLGSVVSGATITVGDNVATGTTDSSGKANIKGIKPGKYTVKATKTGYSDTQVADVEIKDKEEKSLSIIIYKNNSINPATTVALVFFIDYNLEGNQIKDDEPSAPIRGVGVEFRSTGTNGQKIFLGEGEKITVKKPDGTVTEIPKGKIGNSDMYVLEDVLSEGNYTISIELGANTYSYDYTLGSIPRMTDMDETSDFQPNMQIGMNKTNQRIEYKLSGSIPDHSYEFQVWMINRGNQEIYKFSANSNMSGGTSSYWTSEADMTQTNSWQESKVPSFGPTYDVMASLMVMHNQPVAMPPFAQPQDGGYGIMTLSWFGTSWVNVYW